MFLNLILSAINKDEDETARKPYGHCTKISYGELIYTVCTESRLLDSALILGIHENTLYRLLTKLFSSIVDKSNRERWDLQLLKLGSLYKCAKCNKILPITEFYTLTNRQASYCKDCDNTKSKEYRAANLEKCKKMVNQHYLNNKEQYVANRARRRARELNALPNWADLDAIAEFYKYRPVGYHVDHIVPLQGDLVCGLHTIDNLQYLSAKDNLSKGNKFIV